MNVRRVVTGHDDGGKTIVVSDEVVQPDSPEFAPKWSIWAADATVTLSDDGAPPQFRPRWSRVRAGFTSSS